MILTDLLKLWKKTTLVDKATSQSVEMLRTGKQMFDYSLGVLMDNECEVEDIYAMDRTLNHGEIQVRRMIAEHLAVNPQEEAIPALFLASIVGDIERIGDYCKNLIELAHHYPEKLEGPYIDRIRAIKLDVARMYEDTIKAFAEGDAALAASVMNRHAELARTCDGLTDRLLAEQEMCGREAIIRALLFRFLKRVSAHLKNVASSLVNPYHKLGYRPDGTPDDCDGQPRVAPSASGSSLSDAPPEFDRASPETNRNPAEPGIPDVSVPATEIPSRHGRRHHGRRGHRFG